LASHLRLRVRGFKSYRDADVRLSPITLFLGPPDSGKSNLLEAIGLLSFFSYGGDLYSYLRTYDISALFYGYSSRELSVELSSEGFTTYFKAIQTYRGYVVSLSLRDEELFNLAFSDGGYTYWKSPPDRYKAQYGSLLRVRFYRFWRYAASAPYSPPPPPLRFPTIFSVLQLIERSDRELYRRIVDKTLLPPSGDNLGVVLEDSEVRELVGGIVSSWGYNMVKVHAPYTRYKYMLQSEVEGERVLFPLETISDGLFNYILTIVALETSPQDQVPRDLPDIIALEEPESHTYPFLSKELAERIVLASEEGKYIVMSTHNPYIASTVLEKADPSKTSIYWVCKNPKRGSIAVEASKELLDEVRFSGLSSITELQSLVEERYSECRG